MQIFEPLHPLTPGIIANLGNRNIKYLVGQTYTRRCMFDVLPARLPILFTPYSSLAEARAHFMKLQGDLFACIADMSIKKHFDQVSKTISTDGKYDPYYAIVTQDSKVLDDAAKEFKSNIFKWIAINMHQHVNPNESVKVTFSIYRGEIQLIARVLFKSFTMPLSDVESYY